MSNLTDEIVSADTALQQSEELVAESARRLRSARSEHRKCREELSRLIKELRTGESRYPLLERFEAGGEPTPRAPVHAIDDSVLDPCAITHGDLDAAILAACERIGINGESGHWELLRQTGCDDAKILEVLRATWPQGAYYSENDPERGYTIRGGVTPAIWMGARAMKNQLPVLAGLELADRIRRVLEIPRAPELEREPEPVAKPRRKRVARSG